MQIRMVFSSMGNAQKMENFNFMRWWGVLHNFHDLLLYEMLL
jgi:hypothetical protein